MRALVSYFIKYPIAVNLVMVVLFIFGYFSYRTITSTFFPVIPNRNIAIQVVYPGASPEEIEEGIVTKIEDNLKGVTGVERVTSISKENAATITVEVLKAYEVDRVIEDVRNAVQRIPSFPVGMEPVVVFNMENMNFTISYSLYGDNVDLYTLKQVARKVEDDLLSAKGISKVDLTGFPEEEIEVAFNEAGLRAYNITFDQAAQAIRNTNIRVTGGTIRGEKEDLIIRANARGYFARDLEEIVIKALPNGQMVKVKDVALVKDQWEDLPNRTVMNGRRSVTVLVNNTDSEDILTTSAYVKKYFEDFNKNSTGIRATLIRDQAVTLNQRRDLLVENGIMGIILVLILLSMFLHLRIAFWVAASLPVSFFGMFILAAWWGITVNVISLFGMIVVVGILVDDGIVVSENIYSHYERGKNPLRAAIDGITEVLPAVFSAVLTTIIAFSAFFFLDGRSGEFFSEMAFVVIATLFVSLIEVIIILPAHVAHSKALKGHGKKNVFEKFTARLMYLLRDVMYIPLLKFFLRNRALGIAIPIALFLITIGAFQGGIIKATYFPNIERENIDVTLTMPAGTNEEVTDSCLRHIEKAVWEVNAMYRSQREDSLDVVLNVERIIGPTGSDGKLNIVLLDSETRLLSSFEMTNKFREQAGAIFGAENLSYGTPSPFGRPISVSLLSNNFAELDAAKEELKTEMRNLSSLRDVTDSDRDGTKEVKVTLKEKAYFLGLTLNEVIRQVRQGFFGQEVQRVQRGVDEVKIWVRYDRESRKHLTDLEEMRIRMPNGDEYPLSELAEYSIERGVININHSDGKREVRLEADVANPKESATTINSEIVEGILPLILAKYPSVSSAGEGQNREAMKTMVSAQKVLPVILILIISVVTFTFRSFGQTIVIFLLIPISFVGVAWGHFLHGMPLSIFSYLGIVALIGIIVNDSLVLVSKMNGFLKEGVPFEEAVYEAGVVRFRAIFLTSMTTIAGLAPLILEKSFQAQFLVPMAVSVAYGIAVATVLTLLVLPVMLSLLNDFRRGFTWAWNWEKGKALPEPESVEPAIIELEADEMEKSFKH